jgi:NAD-dependent dihydropyrimidine dehydrogenase PreA subunit
MIELVSDARCIKCDLCVKVCPTGVFEAVPDEAPVIARQEDCQTCFMCELYCPTDALFVAPEADTAVAVQEQQLAEKRPVGQLPCGGGLGRGSLAGRAPRCVVSLAGSRASGVGSGSLACDSRS